MARQTTLAIALAMLKAELGYSLTANVAVADDTQLSYLLDMKQQWLASQYDWPFLETRFDVPALAGTRTYNLPTTMNLERPVVAEVFYTNRWKPVCYGIGGAEFNYINSDAVGLTPPQTLDPIQRWRLQSETTFEVWPIPVTAQSFRFTGQAVLSTLKTAGAYDAAKTLDLDDVLVVLFTAAAKLLSLKKDNAQLVLQEAQNRLAFLRGSYPSRDERTIYGQAPKGRERRVVPLIVTHG